MNDEPITEIDMEKYIVLKQEDLDKYIGKGIDRGCFEAICNKINHLREKDGKPKNKYLVLNLNDNVDLRYLYGQIYNAIRPTPLPPRENKPNKVEDIAVDLVNAILKAKREVKIVSGLESLKGLFQGRV